MELVNAIFGAIGTVTLGLEQSELFVNKIIFSYEHLNKLSGNTGTVMHVMKLQV